MSVVGHGWFDGEAFLGFVGVAFDVTDQKLTLVEAHRALREEHERLREANLHDPLTGVFNRAYLDELMRGRRSDAETFPVTVAMVDVDGLKAANDSYGHHTGDQLIKRAARLLQSCVRKGDVVRFGGDEFVVVLPGAGRNVGQALAQRLTTALQKDNADAEVPLRLSVGTALAEQPHELTDAIQRADEVMYQQRLRRRAQQPAPPASGR